MSAVVRRAHSALRERPSAHCVPPADSATTTIRSRATRSATTATTAHRAPEPAKHASVLPGTSVHEVPRHECLQCRARPRTCHSFVSGCVPGIARFFVCFTRACPTLFDSGIGEEEMLQNVCPPGRYSERGWDNCQQCAWGAYGNASGLTSFMCSGPCPAGYACYGDNMNNGPTDPFAHPCPPGQFSRGSFGGCDACQVRLVHTLAPAEGRQHDSTKQTTRSHLPFGVQRRPQRVMRPPPPCMPHPQEGYYGNESAMTTEECSGLCPPGHYCNRGTSQPLECPPGRFCPAVRASTHNYTSPPIVLD
jgi:hypothetical protein